MEDEITLGKIIYKARKKKGYILRDCADLILKPDGTPITFSYLHEIENDRRTPSEYILNKISAVLDIPVEYMYVYAEMFPSNLVENLREDLSQDEIVKAFRKFIRDIQTAV